MSARLLGKEKGVGDSRFDTFARRAFALAKEYFPDSDFLLTSASALCAAENVKFYNGNISGACVRGGNYIRLYSYRVPCSEQYLFIYVGDNHEYFVTMKCSNSVTDYYVEFAFESEIEESFDRSNIMELPE